MSPYIGRVYDNIELFLSSLQDKDIDFQISFLNSSNAEPQMVYVPKPYGNPAVVLSKDPYLFSVVKKNISLLTNGPAGGEELPLGIVLKALAESSNFIPGAMFRPQVGKIVIILSDATEFAKEGSTPDLAYSKARMLTEIFNKSFGQSPWTSMLIGKTKSSPCNGEPGDQNVLRNFVKISGGIEGRICDEDYSAIMTNAVELIHSTLADFSLKQNMQTSSHVMSSSIEVFINGTQIQNNADTGYSFNPIKEAVTFAESVAPSYGDKVEIYFDYYVR
jgi:hypothetical protein